MLVCNTRNLYGTNLTGVQRYTAELLSRLPKSIGTLQPSEPLHGMRGHLWEQLLLPSLLEKRLLWSPANTGPLAVERQVISIMDMSPLDHPEWSSRQFSSWYRWLIPRLVNRVRAVITISEFSKSRILHFCPGAEKKIHVTLLGTDGRFTPADDVAIGAAIAELGLPSKSYLVALGSLEPRKNLRTLLEAWLQIQSLIPDDVWLVLAGGKGKKAIFGEHSFGKLPPRVHLTGHVADGLLPALYSGAIGSVYLSLYEGFGLPPLEAMSCGTAVLTSNTTSLPEVVGDAALTVDPLDVEAVSEKIVALVNEPRLRNDLRQRGLARARLFTWDNAARETWRIIGEAARW